MHQQTLKPYFVWHLLRWTTMAKAVLLLPNIIQTATLAGAKNMLHNLCVTLYAQHPEDVRNSYILPLKDSTGTIQKKNGIPIYYVTKFSFQGGSPTLSSPVMFRLSEMYLNKAEAEAKLGQTTAALGDVDMIRKNRGLAKFVVQWYCSGQFNRIGCRITGKKA